SKKGVLSTLPEPLQTAARVRAEHPEVDLKNLCLLMPEPIGKSGLYHRLQKLSAVARELREEEKK
ncbi:MAG: hypothetical protein II776_05205, partial [Clostridia bacterium]|nr:hypothetical protein [Clostridia bacterium]